MSLSTIDPSQTPSTRWNSSPQRLLLHLTSQMTSERYEKGEWTNRSIEWRTRSRYFGERIDCDDDDDEERDLKIITTDAGRRKTTEQRHVLMSIYYITYHYSVYIFSFAHTHLLSCAFQSIPSIHIYPCLPIHSLLNGLIHPCIPPTDPSLPTQPLSGAAVTYVWR